MQKIIYLSLFIIKQTIIIISSYIKNNSTVLITCKIYGIVDIINKIKN